MAVYERIWRRYAGEQTPLRWRFLVISKYALKEAFASRMFTAFYAVCFLPTVVGLFLVYFSHNMGLLEQLGLTEEFMAGLTLSFFKILFGWQAVPAFFVTVIVSPSLVAADLSNNALALYLARPINRRDYVIGKMAVLGILLSPLTWMSGLAIFVLQSYMEGGSWWLDNVRIGLAYLIGHLSWILVISLLSLAVSALVRFKPVARGALFGIFFILSGLSEAINAITRTHWGYMLNIVYSIQIVVIRLFDPAAEPGLPSWAAWFTLAAVSLISLGLLSRKLRAHEVVR